MIFRRSINAPEDRSHGLPSAAAAFWGDRRAAVFGHALPPDDWVGVDRALREARLLSDRDLAEGSEPPALCEILFGAATLLRRDLIAADDGEAEDASFVRIHATGRIPESPVHPVTRALLTLLDRRPLGLDALRRRVKRAYPGVADIPIEQMLAGIAELLHMGFAGHTEVEVAASQRRLRDHALSGLVPEVDGAAVAAPAAVAA